MFPRDTTSMRATFGLLVAASVAIVPQARAQMEVDSCQELRFPGEYVLTRDLRSPAGNCIVINRSQVTLDGQGHHIVGGVRQGGVGITLGRGADIRDIEIRNVVIAWFGVGIVVGNHARDGVISDVRLVFNDDGLNLDGDQFTLPNSHVALNNHFGARTRGNFNVIEGNTFLNNQIGLYVAFPDSNSVIRDNRFVDHTRATPAQGGFIGRPGMGLLVRSGPTRIRDNLIENNTRGIHIREVSAPRTRSSGWTPIPCAAT